MRKSIISLSVLLLSVACSKQQEIQDEPLTTEERQARITAALTTSNSARMAIASRILLTPSPMEGYHLKEIIATDEKSGFRSFGYILLPLQEPGTAGLMPPNWGMYTGWMLFNDGCWHHGTFVWSGDPSNYVFSADPNPYIDNYVGNEPRCMSDDEFDTYA